MNEHYFITKHFPPPFWLKKSFLQRKWALQLRLKVFPAMYNAISPHEKVAMDNPLYAESFFRHEPFYKAMSIVD